MLYSTASLISGHLLSVVSPTLNIVIIYHHACKLESSPFSNLECLLVQRDLVSAVPPLSLNPIIIMILNQAGSCYVEISVGLSILPMETKVKSKLQPDNKMTVIDDS
jgi:hypothetical protein